METKSYTIGDIPALLWGPPTGKLFLAVHGDMGNKQDAIVTTFATQAVEKGYQVLSIDLPQHGERAGDARPCTPQNAAQDLRAATAHVRTLVGDISLFACSLGAYFSLLGLQNEPLNQAMLLSPVVDMAHLIQSMMRSFSISEAELAGAGQIHTPVGKTLEWDTYQFVRQNPIAWWPVPTAVLCGETDEISPRADVKAFCKRFNARLTVMPEGEHFFHTAEQLAYLESWAVRYML